MLIRPVAVLGFAVLGASGVAKFSAMGTELYYRTDGSKIWGEGVRQWVWGRSPPEAEAFSLNYTLTLYFFEHDI